MTQKFVCQLTARFDGLDNPKVIRERVTVEPRPLDLANMPRHLLEGRVRETLNELYVPTSNDIAFLQDLVKTARAHCEMTYPNDAQYMAGLYTPYMDYLVEPKTPICLTGLAGVGKTSVLRAANRLLASSIPIHLDRDHGIINVVSHWHVQVRTRSTVSALLAPLVQQELGNAKAQPNRLVPLCAKTAFKNGVSMLFMDELQFLTQSSSANTAVTKLLYQLVDIGIPLVFVANYSLCRLLQKRPEQDRQRLLAKPVILTPATPDSNDWLTYLAAVQKALGPSLEVSLQAQQHSLFQSTGGLKRLFVQLLTRACVLARDHGESRVGLAHLKAAYDDSQYSTARRQAEAMLSPSSVRSKEYQCPFPLPKMAAQELLDAQRKAQTQQILAKIHDEQSFSPAAPALQLVKKPKAAKKATRPKLTAEELRQADMNRRD